MPHRGYFEELAFIMCNLLPDNSRQILNLIKLPLNNEN